MNSPSDDGQYTDTDKEEGVIEDDKKSSGSNASFERPSVSGSSSDPSSRNVEIERNLKGHSSTSSSDAENEEARLRQKLLEKRSVLSSSAAATREVVEVERGTSSFVSVTITNVNRKLKTHSGSPKAKILLSRPTAVGTGTSDDEEMFSIQPKDSIVKQRSHSVRPHEYRERERVGHGDKMKKMERSREDKHRHKERKHDKHAHGDQAKRDYGSREARKRHISSKHQQVREHFPGRSLVVESKIAAKSTTIKASHKERESRCEPKVEQLPRIKDTSKSRSPHKRDINASPKRNIIMEIEVPAKKMHLERTDEIKMEVEETGVVDNESKIAETKIPEAHVEMHNCKTKQNADADESHEDEPQISSQRTTPVGLSKYSKFDSDPDDQDEEGETEFPNSKIKAEMIMDSGSDAESDVILRGSDEDDVDLLDLNEEEMANLSPEARARVEEEQQKRLVAKLPVYYPGISGCRNVAEFECLNRIEEGTFGVVYRAKEKKTDEIVALKRLKMEKEKEGFPITSLREINMLLKAGNHPNIVNVREIVIGSNMDKIYLVMEYVEHDMKSLMDTMHARGKRFRPGEVKTLLHQLLCGVAHMHDEWILHRDLKTSNLLLSHKGILKIGDFGLSREFGDPLKPYTPIVVTLWYRAPELLLGVKEYSTAVDLWSCGCIFAEFLKLKPLFPGKGEMDQINKIFADLGSPNDTLWPGYSSLPGPRKTTFDHHEPGELERKFPTSLVDERGLEFLKELLTYDPNKRISAHEALTHDWFERYPLPTPPDMFPTWPAKSELGKSVVKSPITKPPSSKDVQNAKLYKELKVEPKKEAVTSFALKFDVAPKFSK